MMEATPHENEPAFLRKIRDLAAGRAKEQALPSRALHRFRYTDPADLIPKGAALPHEPAGAGVSDVEIDLPGGAAEAGIRAVPFSEALTDPGLPVGDYLGKASGTDDVFLASNLAAFANGTVLTVPAGARIEDPIVLRHEAPDPGRGSVGSSRTLIIAGEGSKATVLEDTALSDGLHHHVTEAFVGEGAGLTHGRIVSGTPDSTGFVHSAYRVARDARLTHIQVDLPGGLLKTEASPVLEGRGANVEGLALALVGRGASSDYRVVEDHAGEDSFSRLTYRTVGLDNGRSAFTGLLKIREGAVRSEAYEEARGLLLSREARAELIPELEILNHEVRCSHGATVGPVDPEAVFYLMSRGFTREDATIMLVEGFVEPVLSRVPAGPLADALRGRLHAVIGTAIADSGPGE